MAIVTNQDLIPRCADAGYAALIDSLAGLNLTESAFLSQLNQQGSGPTIVWSMFLQMLSDLQNEGFCEAVVVQSEPAVELPDPIVRTVAPGGIGYDGASIWFSTPDTGTYYVRWYKNGELVARVEQDLSSNRSILRGSGDGQMDVEAGDVVQICLENQGDIYFGWWGRVEIE